MSISESQVWLVDVEGAAFLPDGPKGAAGDVGDLGVGKLAQEDEFVFCPWPGVAFHPFRLSLLRHLRSNFACEIGMSSRSKRGLWEKRSQKDALDQVSLATAFCSRRTSGLTLLLFQQKESWVQLKMKRAAAMVPLRATHLDQLESRQSWRVDATVPICYAAPA